MQAETQVQGDDQFEARPASGTEPAEPGFRRNRAKSGPVWRYHVYRDRRKLAVPRQPERSVQRRTGRLRHGRAHDEASDDASAVPCRYIAPPLALSTYASTPLVVPSTPPRSKVLRRPVESAQYCAHAYQELVGQFRMQASMSRRGNCFDNAPIESFWGTLKSELVYHRRFATREEARRAISEYIEIFYNRQRTQVRLDYLSPVAFTQSDTI